MKIMFAIVASLGLALMAEPAHAAVATGTGAGITKANACGAAKSAAARQCNTLITGGRVSHYEDCDCEEVNHTYDKWSCSVDAHCKGASLNTVSIIPGVELPASAGRVTP